MNRKQQVMRELLAKVVGDGMTPAEAFVDWLLEEYDSYTGIEVEEVEALLEVAAGTLSHGAGEVWVIWYFVDAPSLRWSLEKNPDPIPQFGDYRPLREGEPEWKSTATALLITNQREAAEAALHALWVSDIQHGQVPIVL